MLKKIFLFILFLPTLLFSQIKVKDLPTTTVTATGDFIIKDDAAGIPGSTKKITVGNFMNFSGWGLKGNSGTTYQNFIGTIDKQSLYLRTYNTTRLKLDSISGALHYKNGKTSHGKIDADTSRILMSINNISSYIDLAPDYIDMYVDTGKAECEFDKNQLNFFIDNNNEFITLQKSQYNLSVDNSNALQIHSNLQWFEQINGGNNFIHQTPQTTSINWGFVSQHDIALGGSVLQTPLFSGDYTSSSFVTDTVLAHGLITIQPPATGTVTLTLRSAATMQNELQLQPGSDFFFTVIDTVIGTTVIIALGANTYQATYPGVGGLDYLKFTGSHTNQLARWELTSGYLSPNQSMTINRVK